jgi:hypothetical protein
MREQADEPQPAEEGVALAPGGRPDWQRLITDAIAKRPKPLVARYFLRRWTHTFSRPMLVECGARRLFVVKARQQRRDSREEQQLQRALVTDHIVGFLGCRIGAPVPDVALVEIKQDLIDVNRDELGDVCAGIAHGSAYLGPDCSERLGLEVLRGIQGDQRRGIARLALLYGWAVAGDHQLLRQGSSIWSADHGHFFPGGPDWTAASLQQGAPQPPKPDHAIIRHAGLSKDEVIDAGRYLNQVVTDELIAEAVARPPDEWGISMQERVAVAQFLRERLDALIRFLGV